jgi:hypothetical protein
VRRSLERFGFLMKVISAASAFPPHHYKQDLVRVALQQYWGDKLVHPDASIGFIPETGGCLCVRTKAFSVRLSDALEPALWNCVRRLCSIALRILARNPFQSHSQTDRGNGQPRRAVWWCAHCLYRPLSQVPRQPNNLHLRLQGIQPQAKTRLVLLTIQIHRN